MTVRIFQLAQELNINSQEILDALDDMGIEVKSNLVSLEQPVVAELRELFKPKPTVAKAPAAPKDDALKRALADREARDRAAREAARREEERKAAARRAALDRVARRASGEAPAPAAAPPAAPPAAAAPPMAAAPPTAPALPAAAGPPAAAAPAALAPEPAAAALAAAPPPSTVPGAAAAAPEAPSHTAPPERPAVRPSMPPPSRLGKAVVAPPPTTAKERAQLLGRPLGEPGRGFPPGRRPGGPAQAPGRPAGGRAEVRPAPAAPGRAERPAAAGRPGDRRAAPAARGRGHAAPVVPATPRLVEPETPVGIIRISEGITVKDLSERMDRKAKDVIKRLFLEKGIMATINHALDVDTAAWVVEAFGGTPEHVAVEDEALQEVGTTTDAPESLRPRPPVVTIMGHVDHGKTSLLDAIRSTRVAEREAGGITQHIGAYKVTQLREGTPREIVFLDTPGHEAFTLMRARGARVTDIVVLVVAADDGVMPQTVESINHAKAAGVPVVVAMNKMDKAGANPDKILQQLADRGILVEQFGGDTVAVPVSAKAKTGLDTLLEMILLVAELADLKANPARPAAGTVLEAKLDRNRGPVATVLVQNGTLKIGDLFVVGSALGRVRALVDERDRRVDAAGPSTPVVVLGLEDVPQAGDLLQVFPDESKARQIALYRSAKQREEDTARRMKLPTIESLAAQIQAGQVNELAIVLKADVQGSVEVLRKQLEGLSTSEVVVKVIHHGTGAISETDILLASASKALVVGFNVRPERGIQEVAKREGVDLRLHTVIYNVTDEIKQAMLNTLSPVEKEVYLGRAEIRQIFRVAKVGTIAGCYVTDGVIRRDAQVRLLRDNVVVHEGRIGSLRRFKDDAREVRSGFECGIGLERYNDLKPGDEIEAYTIEFAKRQSLESNATT